VRRRIPHVLLSSIAAILLAGGPCAEAAFTLLGQFNSGLGTPVSCGFDQGTDGVWVYGDADATLSRFSRAGVVLGTVARPGEAANDVDVTFTTKAMTLGVTALPADTMLFVNGESGVAEIYAVDKVTGSVLATLPTAFGASHVVGGAFHPDRNTIFLVQDRQPSGTTNDNLVAEIDPVTGSVLNSFAITAALSTFTVNYGDLEVAANGNLFVVSSDETTIVELSPTGVLVQESVLPAGVTSLSGLGLDHERGEAWVTGTGGTVWRLGGFPATPSLGRPQLSASKGPQGAAVLDWPPVSGATAYDAVRGDLAALRQTAGDFTGSTTACLANDVASPPVQDPTVLAIGELRWYLVRATAGVVIGSYDTESSAQRGSRDVEIAASASACP